MSRQEIVALLVEILVALAVVAFFGWGLLEVRGLLQDIRRALTPPGRALKTPIGYSAEPRGGAPRAEDEPRC